MAFKGGGINSLYSIWFYAGKRVNFIIFTETVKGEILDILHLMYSELQLNKRRSSLSTKTLPRHLFANIFYFCSIGDIEKFSNRFINAS